jgi:hypothetical protein
MCRILSQVAIDKCLEKFKIIGNKFVKKELSMSELYTARDAIVRKLKARRTAAIHPIELRVPE